MTVVLIVILGFLAVYSLMNEEDKRHKEEVRELQNEMEKLKDNS